MDRSREIDAASAAVHDALKDLAADGHERQDLANVLFAYAMNLMVADHGRQGVAQHLFAVAVKFADEDHNPLQGAVRRH